MTKVEDLYKELREWGGNFRVVLINISNTKGGELVEAFTEKDTNVTSVDANGVQLSHVKVSHKRLTYADNIPTLNVYVYPPF